MKNLILRILGSAIVITTLCSPTALGQRRRVVVRPRAPSGGRCPLRSWCALRKIPWSWERRLCTYLP